MKPLYIFDLDGTLADCQHRTPILAEKHDKGTTVPLTAMLGVRSYQWRE